jgi:hypothetical protein
MSRQYLVSFGVLTVLWALLLLVGPRYHDPIVRPMSYRNIDLPGPFGLSLSVDSPNFMRLALEPAQLFEPRELRQSRPGLVLAAAPLALGLAQIVGPPPVASFLAYMLLHIAILVASFALYLRIVWPRNEMVPLPVYLTGLLLLFNNVTAYFMLSPHTCLFNLLAPLLCLWIADRAWHNDLFRERRVFLVALLSGLGFVSYGSFLLAFPALLLPAVVRERGAGRALGVAFLGRVVAVGAILVAPVVAWYALVMSVNGTFYSAEVEVFRMFVWIADGLRTHGWGWVGGKLVALTQLGMRKGAWMSMPALLIVAAAFLIHPPPRGTLWRQVRDDAVLATFVCVLFGTFFVLSGWVFNRNMYSASVPFIAVAGSCVAYTVRVLPRNRLRVANWAFALAAVVYGALVLVKDVGRMIHLA